MRAYASILISVFIHAMIIALLVSFSSLKGSDDLGAISVFISAVQEKGGLRAGPTKNKQVQKPEPLKDKKVDREEIKGPAVQIEEAMGREEIKGAHLIDIAGPDGPGDTGSDPVPDSEQYDSDKYDGDIYIGGFGMQDGPRFDVRVRPSYPLFARKTGKEGRVVLNLYIDESGELVDVRVIEGAGNGFDDSALKAVKMSTYLPARKNGRPVRSRTNLPIRFVLTEL
ncbi:MAG: energy transducer TonB [Nitrospirota bacterium]|nr:MAG: energy transducer TonB [Nitrospirota bacterium]